MKTLYSEDRARRVLIVERADGHYSLQVQKHYQNIFEGAVVARGWQCLPDGPSVFQTVEIAEREAKTRFPWLARDPHPNTARTISTNEELFETLRGLVDAWCDRRCLRSLRHILAGYPLPSPFTDGWGALYEALRHIRASDRDELTDEEAEAVDDLIVTVGNRLYRMT